MASWFIRPCRATAEEQKTMEPPPDFIIALAEGRSTLKQDTRLVLSTSINSLSVVVCAALSRTDPTQFVTPSTRPNSFTTAAMLASTSLGWSTSAMRGRNEEESSGRPVAPLSSSCSAASFSSLRAISATLAPSCATSLAASAFPMPPVDPNTAYTGSAPAAAVRTKNREAIAFSATENSSTFYAPFSVKLSLALRSGHCRDTLFSDVIGCENCASNDTT
mmetsp:Transcript_38071/g.68297  ORF Transcript_38071/g.68297 Transcript_38071/m.68297 type:complete len:220 (-) Transcript_38071:73-732(-)